MDAILAHEPTIRLSVFACVLLAMAAWEVLAPRRAQAIGRVLRWPNNLGIVAVDTLLVRIVFPTAAAVMIFEVLLNATSMFSHGNVRVSPALDRFLRWLVVTPDMHRVHHSILPEETNSNFGFNFPWWDRLFGTYRRAPTAGHEAMTIGIGQFRDARELRLDRLLLQPFR